MQQQLEPLDHLVSPRVDRAADLIGIAVYLFAVLWFGGHLIAWGLR